VPTTDARAASSPGDSGPEPSREHDVAVLTQLLGRVPRAGFEVVVRNAAGEPVVIRNAPLLDDGTPMPTRYWLVDPDLSLRVARLESAGGVRAAEAAVEPEALGSAHARYARERDAALAGDHADHAGPRPSGGVGGTARGVKCLHAHLAYHLAGGDDPVGRWAEENLR
jgi:uncharacterized protein